MTECAVCEKVRSGAVDTCGHPVCDECMRQWAQTRLDHQETPNCPYCRQEAVGWRAQVVRTLTGTYFRIAMRRAGGTVAELRRAMRATLCVPECCMRLLETRADGEVRPLADEAELRGLGRITVIFRVVVPAIAMMAARREVAVRIVMPEQHAPTLLVVHPMAETVESLARRAGRPHQRKIIREADGALIRASLAPLRDGDTLYFPREA